MFNTLSVAAIVLAIISLYYGIFHFVFFIKKQNRLSLLFTLPASILLPIIFQALDCIPHQVF